MTNELGMPIIIQYDTTIVKVILLLHAGIESLLANKLLVLNYVVQKYSQKLAPLLEAALCPDFLCLPCLSHTLLNLSMLIQAVVLIDSCLPSINVFFTGKETGSCETHIQNSMYVDLFIYLSINIMDGWKDRHNGY